MTTTPLHAHGHADTLLDTSIPPPDAMSSVSLAPSVRTTVLPRVDHDGDGPRLVVDPRDRFEHAELLGRGGVGEVVLARDNDIERPVALKRLLPELSVPDHIGRFVEEIRTLGRLDHPNIVPIHDVGTDREGQLYYVMKYVAGETLEGVIEKLRAGDREYHRRFSFQRRMEIFEQVLRAMQYAHAKGVIHRDIKPANVMIGRFGEVMVMDWGLARSRDEAKPEFPVSDKAATLTAPRRSAGSSEKLRTVQGAVMGTPAYMSPEQARGENENIDEVSDVYSLSIMLHELMTLTHYLDGKNSVTAALAGVLTDEPVFAALVESPHQGPVPAEYAHFIRHGVAKDRAKRYRSVTEMLDRLQDLAEGRIPVECAVTLCKRMGHEGNGMFDRKPWVMLGALITVAALLLVGVATVGVMMMK